MFESTNVAQARIEGSNMRSNGFRIGLRTILAILTGTMFMMGTTASQEELVHNFDDNGKDGYAPYATLIRDIAGNLYGTTYLGGNGTCNYGGGQGCGTVFELTPRAGGGWAEKILHNFNADGRDGFAPYAGLIFDAAGNLYGTTQGGGVHAYGTVFELTPRAGGGWTEKILHSFNDNYKDGIIPYAGVIFDTAGNLYGATLNGGTSNVGTVFELTPTTSGPWKERILHNFQNNGKDAWYPEGNLIFDSSGNLYGTAANSSYFPGAVFELIPKTGGGWTEKILHKFGKFDDGWTPYAGVIFNAGNLYGTTYGGGVHGFGTVFELTPKSSGGWTEKILHSFNDDGKDGWSPEAGLAFDALGNLYGTTTEGGVYGDGTVFELAPNAGGAWKETVLRSFNSTNGETPYSGLAFDASGNLYGTTYGGGTHSDGAVFEIKP
jgi:uncharacterized repeat protein (TIGR03803 family)